MGDRAPAPNGLDDLVRSVCGGLPDACEEPAWVGVRWRIRSRTFAHLLPIVDGRPAAHARAVGSAGPLLVVTFRVPDEDVELFRSNGLPYFFGGWGRDVVGLVLDDRTDRTELTEHLIDSYRTLAPAKLAALVEDPEAR